MAGLLYAFTVGAKPVAQPARILPPTAITPPKPLHGLPARIIIPKLNIDTTVIHLGLTADGNMDTPTKLTDTGWYKYGSHPGDEGSAVIAGHVGVSSKPGIFINLRNLQKGDQISIVDDQNQTATFTVRELRTYKQDGQPPEVFRGKGGAYLNLITCTGSWQKNQQTFSDRLVVFADYVK